MGIYVRLVKKDNTTIYQRLTTHIFPWIFTMITLRNSKVELIREPVVKITFSEDNIEITTKTGLKFLIPKKEFKPREFIPELDLEIYDKLDKLIDLIREINKKTGDVEKTTLIIQT